MPITIGHDSTQGLRLATAVGDVTLKEWLNALEQQVADGEWGFETVVDAVRVTSSLTVDDVKQVRKTVEHLTRINGPRGPVVFIIRPGSHLYGMARMYQLATGAIQNVHVCHSREEAESWLDSRPR